ncbi:hypothetical protein CPT_Mangalyan_188 [Escherichia phage Mangalyan]|nr:hypothetical protein CPT_Mangalyan_188 [Escherichia phage Mangalyan]
MQNKAPSRACSDIITLRLCGCMVFIILALQRPQGA